MSVFTKLQTIVSISLLSIALTHANDLRRDPFQPPASIDMPATETSSQPAVSNSPLKIRGIMRSGDQALVNLGGDIIAPGEESNGYLLLVVAEDHAIFQRGEELVTLYLYSENENETELF